MICFPNCKINLGLRILEKRTDGFHNLETVFLPLHLNDVLEIIETENKVEFSTTGISIPETLDENICIKAFRILKNDFPNLPFLKMHLHKTIPLGAGLGGGSADAAFALKLINQKFELGISIEQLKLYALQLGSDCPFFILNSPCFATGKGEKLTPIYLDLSAYKFILIYPQIHIKTQWAFSKIKCSSSEKSINEIIKQPIETWKVELQNDFEEPIFTTHPELKKIKQNLYDAGATYAAMSGSGSTIFGIFKKEEKIDLHFPSNYFVKELVC